VSQKVVYTYVMAESIKGYIKDFLEYLQLERNASPRTCANYNFYLLRFAKFSHISTPKEITSEKVKKFRLWLNEQGNNKGEGLKKTTQNYHLIALRSFLKYLSRNDIETLAPEKITLAKQEERQVSVLEEDELERFLEGPTAEKSDDIAAIRDKAILETLFSTGLRVSELAALRRDKLNLKKDEHTVRGKGKKLRLVFFSNTARQWIARYLQKRHDFSPALFVRHDRASSLGRSDEHDQKEAESLTPRSIQRIVQFYARLAGITKRITPHTLRHTYATDLLMNGADIRSVQSLLGHASITTTQIYTHITNRQLKDVYHAFHDRTRKKNNFKSI